MKHAKELELRPYNGRLFVAKTAKRYGGEPFCYMLSQLILEAGEPK